MLNQDDRIVQVVGLYDDYSETVDFECIADDFVALRGLRVAVQVSAHAVELDRDFGRFIKPIRFCRNANGSCYTLAAVASGEMVLGKQIFQLRFGPV